ncbi:ABC-three component system protein [Francisella philomiragia]|uniref:HNH endonuclease family protein n=1 Tax=Francisella philomiragia TaxID=28110 RepID=A0A0B6D440_9GAMM|nr:ABC-three component system protein [Francisella philomiragia]AJI53087.1 HNH endonuclease family protein [Francisella philomiragia]
MSDKRKSFPENMKLSLLNEVNLKCPSCGIPLIDKVDGKHKRTAADIAHIYPLNSTATEKKLLLNEEKLSPDNLNDEKNLIYLCKNCHHKYDNPKTLEQYRELVSLKKELIKKHELVKDLYTCNIEDELREILRTIENINNLDDLELNYDVSEVESKLKGEKVIFINEIKNYVSQYFNLVRKVLEDFEDSGTVIASQIKILYIKTKKYYDDKAKIYQIVLEHLKSLNPNQSEVAIRIVIAFFIQNCEVFDAVSK